MSYMTAFLMTDVETFKTASVSALINVDLTEHCKSPRATPIGVPDGISNQL